MVDVAIAVAAKVAKYPVAFVVRQFSYVWNYKTNFENLETEIRKLEGRRDTVQHSVDEARRNDDEIEQHVNNWLDRVKTMTDELSEVIETNDRENVKCFNPKKRYQYSRKALKKVHVVSRLYEEGQFDRISYRVIPKETWIPSSKGYVSFESRISTLENILQALSNPNVNTVGIYGVGGIGKTTLAREVAAHAEDKKLFDVVAFAQVAVGPNVIESNVIEIQNKIADKLGLTFHEVSTSGRASRLQSRLKKEAKVLLVLDNIWERLNLEEVGIPFGDDHKGCKMLLTARDLDVLSNKMDSRDNFMIDPLEKEEAWSLFKEKAGGCIEVDDRLQALAEGIADRCGGFPIAIDSIATALKDKEECVWKDALQELTRPSPRNFEGVAAATYTCIEFSYKQLKGEELKSTFLLCSTMRCPSIEGLLAYGMGLGIFESVKTIEEARNRVQTLIRTLKESSLLLDVDNQKFSLHDVVHDVARSIASRDWDILTMKDKVDMRELVRIENCIGISLHGIGELVDKLECSKLQFLYMRIEGNVLQIPDNFFTWTLSLKVLHLFGLNLYSVPTSFHCLKTLKTLYVDCCEFRDTDFIGELEQLEILRISSYQSFKFSEKMRNLSALRWLDISCHSNFDISPNVISTLTKLEELYLNSFGDFTRGRVGVSVLEELKYLSHLTALEISIRDANVLPKGRLLSRRLERFNIVIGVNRYDPFRAFVNKGIGDDSIDFFRGCGTSSSRVVKLNLSEYSCDDDVLHETPSVYKFLSGLDGVGFPDLECLHLQKDSYFCTIVDHLESKSCNPFPSLESLDLRWASNLEKICNSLLKTGSFGRLRDVSVENCHNLKNMFTLSTYTPLPLLQEVSVFGCDNLEHIFVLGEEEEDVNKNKDIKNKIEFKQLSSVYLNSLPRLTSFCSITNNEDEMLDTPSPLFNQKVMFPNLETLKLYRINFKNIWRNELPAVSSCFPRLRQLRIRECRNLKVLFSSSTAVFPSLEEIEIDYMDGMERIWPKQLCMDSLFNLKSVAVANCNKLVTIFQSNLLERLITRLETLIVRDCELVEEIFNLQELNYGGSHVGIETQLRRLYIFSLPKLKHIWNKDPQNTFSFQKLCKVEVFNCASLRYIFHVSLAKNLPQLDQLSIFSSGVEEIVADEGEAKVAATFVFPQITFLNLQFLPELKTFYRGVHTTKWLNLEEVTMYSCKKVELFASELFFQGDNEGQHDISLQPLFMVEKMAFRSLKSVKIKNCDKLETIFQLGTLEELSLPNSLPVTNCASVEDSPTVTHQLEELSISSLPNLKYIWKKDPRAKLSVEGLPLPKKLTITGCNSIEEIFDFREVNFETSHCRAATYGLQELAIDGLKELRHIWHNVPQAKFPFENLQQVQVSNCQNLKELFPACIAWNLSQLVKLDVKDCEKMEEIVAKEAEERPGAMFVFPKVPSIRLENLPELRAFHPGKHPSKWSDLRELEVINCNKIESLASDLCGFQGENERSHFDIPGEQPFFLVDKDSFPKLEVLTLWGKGVRILLQGQYSEELFCNLKFLKVCNDESTVFPLCIFQRFRHLQKLELEYGSYEEIFSKKDNKINDGMVSQSSTVLQNLESLEVRGCEMMIQLVSFSVSFKSLTSLHVSKCNGLTNVVTSSTAKSFGELTELTIGWCNSMTEVVAKEGDVTEDKIIFNKLRTLGLYFLPSLSCFCSEKYTFELPSLEKLIVSQCPKMKYYTSGEVTTQKLEKVTRNYKNHILDGDLNTTIQNTGRYLE